MPAPAVPPGWLKPALGAVFKPAGTVVALAMVEPLRAMFLGLLIAEQLKYPQISNRAGLSQITNHSSLAIAAAGVQHWAQDGSDCRGH